MKKLIQIVFCLLVSFSAFGQEMKDSTLKNKNATYRRVSFGFFINPSYSYRIINHSSSDVPQNYQYKHVWYGISPYEADEYRYNLNQEVPEMGWNLGIKTMYHISKHFSSTLGISFDKQSYGTKVIDTVFVWHFAAGGTNNPYDTVFNRYQFKYTYFFLSIPLAIRFIFIKNEKISFYFSTEESFNYFYKYQGKLIDHSTAIPSSFSLSSIPNPQRFNLYTTISIGIQWRKEKISFTLEPYFRYNLTPIHLDYHYKMYVQDMEHLFQIGLSTTLYFNFKKKSKT